MHSRADAEDAVAEAFLRIARNFKIIHKEICPKTANQFVIITRNVAIDMYRKAKRESPVSLSEEIPDNAFECFDESEILKAMGRLSESDKDILYLHYIYGFSVRELVRILSSNESAVQKRIWRAKIRLKGLLEKEE